MPNHEPTAEDEYFAREEIEKHYKLARELAARTAQEEADARRAAHYMKCPNCGNDLNTVKLHGVDVARCFYCHGSFLDEASFEKLAQTKEEGPHRIIDAIVNVFQRPGKD